MHANLIRFFAWKTCWARPPPGPVPRDWPPEMGLMPVTSLSSKMTCFHCKRDAGFSNKRKFFSFNFSRGTWLMK